MAGRNDDIDDKLIEEIKGKIKDKKTDTSFYDRARSLDWKNPDEVKGYLDNLYVEYSFQCFNERRAESCHRLANFLENIRKKFEDATKLYKTTCDEYKYSHSCITYAKNTTLGRGCNKDLLESCRYNIIACDLGVDEGCYNSAICMQEGIGGLPKNNAEALKYYQKSCELKYPKGCLRLFEWHLKGNEQFGIKQNKPKAFEFTKRACDMNDIAGCVNAAVMLRKGDGIPQNEAEAVEYRQKAEELVKEISPKGEKPGIVFGEQHK